MPKIIVGLRERILHCTKDIILEKGFTTLTIRDVAKECGIAVGTLYNYFKSKEVLTISVLIDDFIRILDELSEEVDSCGDAVSGLEIVYTCVSDFMKKYENIRNQRSLFMGCQNFIVDSQLKLKNDLENIMGKLLDNGGYENTKYVRHILADDILSLCTHIMETETNVEEAKNEYLKVISRVMVKKN